MDRALIERAIDSAKARIYKLTDDEKKNPSVWHQKKIERQKEVMEVTVEALERMLPKKPKLQVRGVYDDDNGDWICDSEWHMCPTCTIRNEVYPTWEYCRYCGQRLDWSE